jgi:hypothetical protein
VPPIVISLKQSLQRPQVHTKDVFDQKLEFSADWFSRNQENWDRILDDLEPKRILEIGSYEGMSTSYIIEKTAVHRPVEIHCIDTWEGGVEHQEGGSAVANMSAVERTFRSNVGKCVEQAPHPVDLHTHKCFSHQALCKLIADGREEYFDLIYIDGSHQAPDVLTDAVLGFKLLRTGGILIFDDYLWEEPLPGGPDPVRCPKPAIDAFVNLNIRNLNVLRAPLYQLYARKIGA